VSVSGRAVVLATPATTSRELVRASDEAVARLLDSVRYARYTVVAFELLATKVEPDFRCILMPNAALSLVMQQANADRSRRILLAYYSEEACLRHADTLGDDELIASAKRDLTALGVAGLKLDAARSHVKRWALSGTVLSAELAQRKALASSRATRRVFIAGDYAAAPPRLGYGLDDAVSSGRVAAALVDENLKAEL